MDRQKCSTSWLFFISHVDVLKLKVGYRKCARVFLTSLKSQRGPFQSWSSMLSNSKINLWFNFNWDAIPRIYIPFFDITIWCCPGFPAFMVWHSWRTQGLHTFFRYSHAMLSWVSGIDCMTYLTLFENVSSEVMIATITRRGLEERVKQLIFNKTSKLDMNPR